MKEETGFSYKEMMTDIALHIEGVMREGGGAVALLTSSINGQIADPYRIVLAGRDIEVSESQRSAMMSGMATLCINEFTGIMAAASDRDVEEIRREFIAIVGDWVAEQTGGVFGITRNPSDVIRDLAASKSGAPQ